MTWTIANANIDTSEYQSTWVVVESENGEIHPGSFEALAAARELVDVRGGEVVAVMLGNEIADKADSLIHHSADSVIVMEDAALSPFTEETHAAALARLARNGKPEVIVGVGTLKGRALLPRLAALLHTGCIADCIGLEVDPDTGGITGIRPTYVGNKIAKVSLSKCRPQIASVRPRAFEALEEDTSRSGQVQQESFDSEDAFSRKRVLDEVRESGGEIKLPDADYIVSGGRGLKGPEGFALLKDLADVLGGAVGASRAAVDSGWIAYPHQVGQTGQTVKTKVYIACGISGQSQHLVGMQSSDFIIAINKDPEAPLMKAADVAVVGDLYEIIPKLTEKLKK